MTNVKATPSTSSAPAGADDAHQSHAAQPEQPAATDTGNPVDPQGGRFAFRATVFDADDLRRAHTRIAHEIVERNHGAGNVVLAGLYTRGLAIAHRLAAAIAEFEDVTVPVGALDVAFYRDDIGLRPVQPLGPTEFPVDIGGMVVVLVDDVLYTGRTVRAALDALTELGRPQAVQLAILVDRGHRELPIRPDFVGKNLPTQQGEDVRVRLTETDAVTVDSVELWAYEAPEGPGVDERRVPTTGVSERGEGGAR